MKLSPQGKLVNYFSGLILLLTTTKLTVLMVFFIIIFVTHFLVHKRIKLVFLLFCSIFLFSFFFSIYNIYFIKSGKLLVSFFNIDIYSGAIMYVLIVTFKMVNLIIFTNLVMLSLSNAQFVYAIKKCFGRIRFINVSKFATTIMLCMKFIPILLIELNHIIKAQKIRGLKFSYKNPFKLIVSCIPVLIPLFKISFNKASKLAIALDLKLYDENKNRSEYYYFKTTKLDVIFFSLIITLIFLKLLLINQ